MTTSAFPRWRSVANALVASALAAFAISSFANFDVLAHPEHYGEFGLSLRGSTVSQVTPGSAAEKAGLKVGDILVRPAALRDRALLFLDGPPVVKPGERVTILTESPRGARTVTLTAAPLLPMSLADMSSAIITIFGLFVFVSVGLTLVLLKPNRMVWGFYLLSVALSWVTTPNMQAVGSWQVALVFSIAANIIVMASVAGLLVFCARFPTNVPTGWRRTLDVIAPYVFPPGAALLVWHDLAELNLAPAALVSRLDNALTTFDLSAVAVCTAAILTTYFASAGLDRHRIKWVMFGWGCTALSLSYLALGTFESWNPPLLIQWALGLLFIALPITVAYAVLKHRVIDIRFVLGRSLAIAMIVLIIALILIGVDWLVSTRLPTSRVEAALYAAIILLIGFSLNLIRQRLGTVVDRLFFRQWHRTQEQANILADTVRRAPSKVDLYEPLSAGVARTFSLTSSALFERVEDGGFVRVAAFGWPTGTIWHIMPDDPLVRRADERLRTVDVDAFQWAERALPSGGARPSMLIPVIAAKRVPAILFLGPHDNGAGLDPDELRIIRRLTADAGALYASSTGSERAPLIERQRAPLGV